MSRDLQFSIILFLVLVFIAVVVIIVEFHTGVVEYYQAQSFYNEHRCDGDLNFDGVVDDADMEQAKTMLRATYANGVTVVFSMTLVAQSYGATGCPRRYYLPVVFRQYVR